VAAALNARGLATLLLDLLTPEEDQLAASRFDIGLLSRRLLGAIDWTQAEPALRGLPLGLFGASTGAASALEAAARRPALVGAVVSRGGRPDLASPGAMTRVRAPCLLLVGGEDREVLALNRAALASIGSGCRLQVVPGATHLFEESGALEAVARAAGDWFERWLLPAPTASRRA
jgi:putative phosphoribosyl transferase